MVPLNEKPNLVQKDSTNLHSSDQTIEQDVIKTLYKLPNFVSLPEQTRQVFKNELASLLHGGCWPDLANPLVAGGVFVLDQLSFEEQVAKTLVGHPNVSAALRTFLQEARRAPKSVADFDTE